MVTPEAQARKNIDRQLEAVGSLDGSSRQTWSPSPSLPNQEVRPMPLTT